LFPQGADGSKSVRQGGGRGSRTRKQFGNLKVFNGLSEGKRRKRQTQVGGKKGVQGQKEGYCFKEKVITSSSGKGGGTLEKISPHQKKGKYKKKAQSYADDRKPGPIDVKRECTGR